MKVIWEDNQPKFKPGDIITYTKGGNFYSCIVGVVKEARYHEYTAKEKAKIEAEEKPRRGCCGKTEINMGIREFTYTLATGEKVPEGLIWYEGIGHVNDLINYWRDRSNSANKAIRKACLELGVDEYELPRN